MAEYIKNRIDHDSHMIKTEDLQSYIDNNVVLVQGVFKDDYVPEFKIFLVGPGPTSFHCLTLSPYPFICVLLLRRRLRRRWETILSLYIGSRAWMIFLCDCMCNMIPSMMTRC